MLTIANRLQGRYCIYTYKRDVVEALSFLNFEADVICDDKGSLNPFIVRSRKKTIKKWIDAKAVKNVYFFHEGYCDAANWMMLYVKQKQNPLFHYIPIAKSYFLETTEFDNSFRSKLKSIYCRICWGYRPLYPVLDKNCGCMPFSYYSRIGVTYEENVNVDKNIFVSLLSEDKFPSNAFVLLDNPNAKNEKEKEKYTKLLEDTIRHMLSSYNFVFKNHPGRTSKIGLERELKEIPSFISGNLLTKRFRGFVGVNSALICEAANDGSIGICLIHLCKLDKNVEREIVDYHNSLSKSIKYPKSIDEFKSYIISTNK